MNLLDLSFNEAAALVLTIGFLNVMTMVAITLDWFPRIRSVLARKGAVR